METKQAVRSSITVLFRMAAAIIAVIFGIMALVGFLNNDEYNSGIISGITFILSGGISAAFFLFMAKVIELKEAALFELRQLNAKE